MVDSRRYTLLQVRNSNDPMCRHEVMSFARVLETSPAQIRVFDVLSGRLSRNDFAETDLFLLGGSGHYSSAGEGEWLQQALETLRQVHGSGIPTFASCWGFQALARAMGGRVVNDLPHAELGTHQLFLTEAGRADPVFGPLGESFYGQMGHEDRVVELPENATLLASTLLVENQAYRFDDAPIYCTQFHPELNTSDLMLRVNAYPEYVERIAGQSIEEFSQTVRETVEAEGILKRFVAMAFGD